MAQDQEGIYENSRDQKGDMGIKGVAHISLVVANIERSLAFYQGVLGLEMLRDRPGLDFPGAWLAIGDQQLHLLEVTNPDPVAGRPEHVGRDRHLALYANELDKLLMALEINKIVFTRSRSGRAAVFFRDPDGNGIELIQT